MIQDCDGYLVACNGSTAAECQVFVEEEEEFMMDTEEHRKILATNNGGGVDTDNAGNPHTTACDGHCDGNAAYNVGHRPCVKFCDKGFSVLV